MIKSADELDDLSLVALCKDELPYSTGAFEALLKRYEPLVFSTCMYLLKNSQDAEEVCQDTCLKIFQHIHSFDNRSTFKTWLYRVVHNQCNSRLKKTISKRLNEEQFISRSVYENVPSSKEQPDGFSDPLEEALEDLSDDDRSVIILRFVSGLSLDEIASALNISLSAAKMRLYRAVDRFKMVYRPPHKTNLIPEHVTFCPA